MPADPVVSPAAGSAPPPPAAPPLPRPRRRLDRLVTALARLVTRVFFRGIEMTGAERLPASGPLLIVGNHQNGLIDPLLLVVALAAPIRRPGSESESRRGSGPGSSGRMPRFLATHTLWRNPALRPWLELGGVIPIYRPKDVGPQADPAQNAAAFARCHAELGAGGVVALFPEGTSHSEPSLVPLKTGAARIVLEAVRRYPGIAPLVVPIGLTFDAKATLRSRVLIEVGEPLDPAPEIAADRAAGGAGLAAAPAAVRQLTARIDGGLKAVTLNYPSWREALLLARAGGLFARDAQGGGGGLPGEESLAAQSPRQRAFIESYGELARRAPEPTAAAVAAVESYVQLLGALGLRDDQVAASYPLVGAARWFVLTLLRLALYLPLAVLGMVLNWLTYRGVGRIAVGAGGTADVAASYKVFGGIVLFPLTWCIEAGLAAWLAGPPAATRAAAALAVLVAAPLAGWVALHFDDDRIRLWNEARAYLLLRTRRAIAGELRARRAAAAAAVAALAALAAPAGAPQSPS